MSDLNAPGWVNVAGEWRWTGAGEPPPPKHDLALHLAKTGAIGVPVEGCPRCDLEAVNLS